MRLFLIRHAETEHNVAGLLAGITDSRLTSHGVQQTHRLGRGLVVERGISFSHVFASDLSRAMRTAGAIADATADTHGHVHEWEKKKKKKKKKNKEEDEEKECDDVRDRVLYSGSLRVEPDPNLREQDFGSLECQPWSAPRPGVPLIDMTSPAFRPKETHEAMAKRMRVFLRERIIPLLRDESGARTRTRTRTRTENGDGDESEAEKVIAVVSHGIALSVLWKILLASCAGPGVNSGTGRVLSVSPQVRSHTDARGGGLGYDSGKVPGWSNTGYLECELHLPPAPAPEVDFGLGPGRTEEVQTQTQTQARRVRMGSESGSGSGPMAAGPVSTTSCDGGGGDDGFHLPQDPDHENNENQGQGKEEDEVEKGLETLRGCKIRLLRVNETAHLQGLRRTRGGVGSAVWDERQGTLDGFFGKGGNGRGKM